MTWRLVSRRWKHMSKQTEYFSAAIIKNWWLGASKQVTSTDGPVTQIKFVFAVEAKQPVEITSNRVSKRMKEIPIPNLSHSFQSVFWGLSSWQLFALWQGEGGWDVSVNFILKYCHVW